MHQRDRQWATLVIWGVFLLLVTIAVSTLLTFNIDYTALWPPGSLYYLYGPLTQPQTIEELRTVLEFAQAALPTVEVAARESLAQQMALQLPIATVVTLMLTLAATVSTWFIWRHAGLEAHLALKALDVEKQKRRSRIERFVEELGEAELVELRSRLVEDDGSVHSLGKLVQEPIPPQGNGKQP
jgi:hypothetical protein